MEESEQNYRATPTTSRKYAKRLTDFVTDLVRHGRYLEAKHFFLELCKISPEHDKTIRLGYTIATATFDNDWVLKYDKLLIDSASDTKEVLWFQLRYYQSQNNVSACEIVSCDLLEKRLNRDQLSTILEVCIERQNYVIADSLARHLAKNRIELTSHTKNRFKQIIITELVNTIQRHL